MRSPSLMCAVTLLAALACRGANGPDVEPEPEPESEIELVALESTLEPLREAGDLPALAALIWRDGAPFAEGAVGLRSLQDSATVTRFDRWHLGSCTKTMTATLAAVLVHEGRISWDTTVGEVFADAEVHPDLAAATLQDLLGNRGGLPTDVPSSSWAPLWDTRVDPRTHRARFAREMLARPPAVAIGTYRYSNAGFMIAGAMLEVREDTAWETLMQERLFGPLGMSSCGFGPPATQGQIDAPYGHDAAMSPIPPGPAADNPPALGPAGTVHCDLRDWARFLGEHAQGPSGGSSLLPAAAFERLHAVGPGNYALGWAVAGHRPWAEGVALTHSGSNTMFFATAWVAPERGVALIAATNRGGAGQALDAVFGPLIEVLPPR